MPFIWVNTYTLWSCYVARRELTDIFHFNALLLLLVPTLSYWGQDKQSKVREVFLLFAKIESNFELLLKYSCQTHCIILPVVSKKNYIIAISLLEYNTSRSIIFIHHSEMWDILSLVTPERQITSTWCLILETFISVFDFFRYIYIVLKTQIWFFVFPLTAVHEGSILLPSADSVLLRFLDLSWPLEYQELGLPFPSLCLPSWFWLDR